MTAVKQAKYNTATPYLAAYIMLIKENKVAMVLRKNTKWMDGHWGLLSGKVEKNESFTAAALREANEEGGVTLSLDNLRLKLIAQRHSDDSDWVDAVFDAEMWEGEVTNAEPHMHSKLEWFPLDDLPENTIPAVKIYIQAILAGNTYIEYGWPRSE